MSTLQTRTENPEEHEFGQSSSHGKKNLEAKRYPSSPLEIIYGLFNIELLYQFCFTTIQVMAFTSHCISDFFQLIVEKLTFRADNIVRLFYSTSQKQARKKHKGRHSLASKVCLNQKFIDALPGEGEVMINLFDFNYCQVHLMFLTKSRRVTNLNFEVCSCFVDVFGACPNKPDFSMSIGKWR